MADNRKDHLWKVAEEAEERMEQLMPGDHPVGLDVGTSKIVAARKRIKGNEIQTRGATPSSGLSLEATLQNQLAPHYSPLNGLENLAAGVIVSIDTPGETLHLPGFEVGTAPIPQRPMWSARCPMR